MQTGVKENMFSNILDREIRKEMAVKESQLRFSKERIKTLRIVIQN